MVHFLQIATTLAAIAISLTEAQQCPAEIKSPSPANARCGGKFVSAKPAAAIGSPTTGVTASNCAGSCLDNPACKSLTFRPRDKQCTLYKRTGETMGLTKSTDGTLFYSSTCFTRKTPQYPQNFQMRISSSTSLNNFYAYADDGSTYYPMNFYDPDEAAQLLPNSIFSFDDRQFLYTNANPDVNAYQGANDEYVYRMLFDNGNGGYYVYGGVDPCSLEVKLSIGGQGTGSFYACTGRSNPTDMFDGIYFITAGQTLPSNCAQIKLIAEEVAA